MLPSVVATSAFVGGIPVPEAEATVRSFRFATDDLPEPQRDLALRGLRERGLLPLEPLPGRVAHVDITKQFLPGIGVLCGTLAGLRQEASPQQQDAGDELFFGVNLSGRSAALQRQREITFKDGEAVLFSGANGGFSVVRPTLVRFVGLRMSQKRLAPFARGQDDSSMRVIPANVAPLGLLASYVGAIANMAESMSTEMSGVIAAHLHDLVALSLGPTRDAVAAAAGSLRAARLQAIKRDVAARLLDDPDLTVAAIAARHQVTPRYVHKLFERDGMTFTRFVLEQRLDHACRRLRNPQFSARSISSIAYDVGFGDLSYFNRVFRRRYGATPSDIRQLVQLNGSPG